MVKSAPQKVQIVPSLLLFHKNIYILYDNFFDIELLKQIGDRETKITETTDEIAITFEIPKRIRNTDATVTRTYQIMRNHDGVVDILDVERYDVKSGNAKKKTVKSSPMSS